MAEAIEIKGLQRGAGPRQYRERRQMLLRSRGYRGGLASDKTESWGRGYRDQRVTEGGWPATKHRAEAVAIEIKALPRGAGPRQYIKQRQRL